MSDYGNLNDRVEKAVEKFQKSEQQRRSENQSLSRILNDLHTKFDARTMELDYCQQRIVQLEGSNNSLTKLVTRLVEIVEKTADDAAEDPVYSASAAASDIVDRYVGGRPVNDEPEISGPELEGGRNARPITEAQAFDRPAGRVENIEANFCWRRIYTKNRKAHLSFRSLCMTRLRCAEARTLRLQARSLPTSRSIFRNL